MTTTPSRAMRRQYVVDARKASDHGEYAGMVRRVVRSLARRVAGSDPDDLLLMLGLRDELDAAIHVAVKAQRAAGFSWAEIAAPLGMTRQAAQQRWGADE